MNICMDESTGKGYTTYTIKENDIVIIKTSIMPDLKQVEKIQESWTKVLNEQGYKNVRVLVLSRDISIEVITKDRTGEITVD